MGTNQPRQRLGPGMEADAYEVALRSLYDANVEEVYRYVFRRCRDHSLAEDITQDVFVAAIRSHGDGELTIGWLLRTARNRLIDIIRRSDVFERKLRLLGSGRAGESLDGAIAMSDRVEVDAAMKALNKQHRLILMLHYVDDLSIDELAQDLGRSRKGTEALLTRARAALRTELEMTA